MVDLRTKSVAQCSVGLGGLSKCLLEVRPNQVAQGRPTILRLGFGFLRFVLTKVQP